MILLIDNYDSFSYNLFQLIGEIESDVMVFRNDKINLAEIEKLNPEAIILSPGPGKPENAGICIDIVKKFHDKIPILGVCLGHQAICEVFGSSIIKAKKLMHGKTSQIEYSEDKIFKNIKCKIKVARYHSLAVDTNTLSKALNILSKTEDGEIMAVKYKNSNIYGLQFHPESVLTPDGLIIIENFLKIKEN